MSDSLSVTVQHPNIGKMTVNGDERMGCIVGSLDLCHRMASREVLRTNDNPGRV